MADGPSETPERVFSVGYAGTNDAPAYFEQVLQKHEDAARRILEHFEVGERERPDNRSRFDLPCAALYVLHLCADLRSTIDDADWEARSFPTLCDTVLFSKKSALLMGQITMLATQWQLLQVEDDIRRGKQVRRGQKYGHEAVYGTAEQKQHRWESHKAAYEAALAEGYTKSAAASLAAERCGVSTRTIYRSLDRAGS